MATTFPAAPHCSWKSPQGQPEEERQWGQQGTHCPQPRISAPSPCVAESSPPLSLSHPLPISDAVEPSWATAAADQSLCGSPTHTTFIHPPQGQSFYFWVRGEPLWPGPVPDNSWANQYLHSPLHPGTGAGSWWSSPAPAPVPSWGSLNSPQFLQLPWVALLGLADHFPLLSVLSPPIQFCPLEPSVNISFWGLSFSLSH